MRYKNTELKLLFFRTFFVSFALTFSLISPSSAQDPILLSSLPLEILSSISSHLSAPELIQWSGSSSLIRGSADFNVSDPGALVQLDARTYSSENFRALFSNVGILRHTKNLELLIHNDFDLQLLRVLPETLLSLKIVGVGMSRAIAQSIANANGVQLSPTTASSNQMGDEGVHVLASANLPNLTSLSLVNHQIGDEGASVLAGAEFPRLTFLELDRNEISDAGAIALSVAKFPKLSSLSLFCNKIGDVGALALAYAPFFHLTYLELHLNRIQNAGEALVEANLADPTVFALPQ